MSRVRAMADTFPTGIAWYRKTLVAIRLGAESLVWIDFEGVAPQCEVWLNGKLIGNHRYAYTPFRFDLSDRLTFDSPNCIAVRVDNSHQPNSRWYTGSGIYRHVWLTVTDQSMLPQWPANRHHRRRTRSEATVGFPPRSSQ